MIVGKKILLNFLGALFICGAISCGKVELEFKSIGDAVAAGAIHENSYIPDCLPLSSTDIYVSFDPDLNIGRGGFRFDTKDRKEFEIMLEKNTDKGASLNFEFTENGEIYRYKRHCLSIDWENGNGEFIIE